MCRMTAFAMTSVGLVWLAWQTPTDATAGGAKGPRHPHMHHALRQLRECRAELREAAHDFGGHREKALKAVDAAIVQIDKALVGVGDNVRCGQD